MNILIVGYGFVGTATEYLFRDAGINIHIEDPLHSYIFMEDEDLDYIFLCVPTDPDRETGKLDISLLSEVYNYWKDKGKIVIRSTIGPDQVDFFPEAIMMPEFLREKHWQKDVDDPVIPIITSDYKFTDKLQDLLPNKCCWYLRPKEAMMYKLARNTALAMKVAVANQLYEICETYKMDYATLGYMIKEDLALGYSHWEVPGHDGKLGFGGKCLPKDLTHMSTLCYSDTNIFQQALDENMVRRIISTGENNELN